MSISQPTIHICTHFIYENLRITFALATKRQYTFVKIWCKRGQCFAPAMCCSSNSEKSVLAYEIMEIQHLLTIAGQEKEDIKIRSLGKNVINGKGYYS